MLSCGIPDCDVIAIIDRVSQYVQARDRNTLKHTAQPVNSFGKASNKRLSMLL
jgi:hypothetical protein